MQLVLLATIIIIAIIIIYIWCRTSSVNLDNNATTDPYGEVLRAMVAAAKLGNPSSDYSTEAKNILEKLRCSVLESLGLDKTIYRCIITSGASESNNLLLRGFPGKKIVSAMEHKTSIECAQNIGADIVPGDPRDVGWFAHVPHETGALLSIMTVNNETGALNPIGEIARMAHRCGMIVHSDIVQFYGKMDLTNPIHADIVKNIDCFSISMHKIHGPTGIGVLVIPRSIILNSQICGTQNDGYRGGTENVMGCAGSIVAIKKTLFGRRTKNEKLYAMNRELRRIIGKYCQIHPYSIYKGQTDSTAHNIAMNYAEPVNCQLKPIVAVFLADSLNTTLVSFIFKYNSYRFCNIKFRKAMIENGIKVSIGSACATSLRGSSHVLHEMMAPFIIRAGTVRLSLGDFNCYSDLYYFEKIFRKVM